MPATAIEITRSHRVESTAALDLAVVDSRGCFVAWVGDPQHPAYWRSSAKPFQALPMVLSGAADDFDLSEQELAIVSASHGGEPRHLALVQSILAKIRAQPSDLICGKDWPITAAARDDLIANGQSPTVLHNNCSGKHSGMLMLATQLGAPWTDYHHSDHPVQKAIVESVRTMTGLSAQEELATGVDGCGVPTFYLPLSRMAFGFAQLVDPRRLDPSMQSAAHRVAEAVRRYPEIISGKGRLEQRLAVATKYRVAAKGGAEAVFCLGIPERGWGLAMKIADGSPRALGPALIDILKQLGLMDSSALEAVQDLIEPIVRNQQGVAVGEVRSVVRLSWARIGLSLA